MQELFDCHLLPFITHLLLLPFCILFGFCFGYADFGWIFLSSEFRVTGRCAICFLVSSSKIISIQLVHLFLFVRSILLITFTTRLSAAQWSICREQEAVGRMGGPGSWKMVRALIPKLHLGGLGMQEASLYRVREVKQDRWAKPFVSFCA